MRRSIAAFTAACAGLLGCGGTPAAATPDRALRVLTSGVDSQAWLGPDAARARAAGASALEVLGGEIVSEGDRVGAFVEVPEGECLLAMARSSPTVVDVDLFAYDDDGSSFAADESPDAQAAFVVCPPHPRRLYIAARVVSGSGILAVGAQLFPKAAQAAVEKATGARGRAGPDTGGDLWPGLEGHVRAHRAAIGARWDELRRIGVPVHPRAATRVSVTVEAGRCIDILVSPSEEVGSTEVVAEDPSGRIFARAREYGRDRALVVCSALTSPVTIAVRPRSSHGIVALVVGRSAVGAESELTETARVAHIAPTSDVETARRALDRDLRTLGYLAPKREAAGTAKVGVRVSVPLELPPGCARIDAIGGKPLSDIAATLWEDKGKLLADARGGAAVTLFPCGKGGPAHLDLEALESPGPFLVELRKDKSAPPALVGHPLAAARLLARIAAAAPADAAAAAAAEVIALDPSSLKSLPLSIPANGCVEVLAALDAGGMGLDLRLVDGVTREGRVTRARHVVSDRLCSGGDAKTGTVELRLDAGRAEALVIRRPAPGP